MKQATTTQNVAVLGFLALTSLVVSYAYAVPNKPHAHPYYIAGVAALSLLLALELSNLYITVSWGVLATLSLLLGLQTNRPVPKIIGLILLALTVAKLFLVDTLALSEGLRVVAYITLGALLLLGSILYKKYVN